MYKTASRFLQHRAEHSEAHSKSTKTKKKIILVPHRMIKIAFKKNKCISGKIIGQIKGGYAIHIFGCKAFCPFSEMYPKIAQKSDLLELQKKSHEFVIMSIDSNSVVVSRKKAVRILALSKAKAAFKQGTIIPGIVKEIKECGR